LYIYVLLFVIASLLYAVSGAVLAYGLPVHWTYVKRWLVGAAAYSTLLTGAWLSISFAGRHFWSEDWTLTRIAIEVGLVVDSFSVGALAGIYLRNRRTRRQLEAALRPIVRCMFLQR
jgi:uncharacterized membrane protein YoaK (UPF0700 family)